MKTIFSILVVALLTCRSAAQFTRAPPYPNVPRTTKFEVDMNPATTGCSGIQCDLTVWITLPNVAGGEDPQRPAPFPVIFFINGFQVRGPAGICMHERRTDWPQISPVPEIAAGARAAPQGKPRRGSCGDLLFVAASCGEFCVVPGFMGSAACDPSTLPSPC